jgi:serine protease AprX
MKKIFVITIAIGLAVLPMCSWAQAGKYLVLFKDKTGNPHDIKKPETFLSKRAIDRRSRQGISVIEQDLPVNPAYVTQVQQTGAKVSFRTKWFNGVLVEATAAQLAAIKALAVVKGVEFNKALATARLNTEKTINNKFGIEAPDYGLAKAQNLMLGIDKLHDKGFKGETMLIAIMDGGFRNSNINTSLKPIYDEKRLLYTFDYVKNETAVYEDIAHGHNCFSIMASNLEGQMVGPAPKASFILLRTEDDNSETRIEEANWVFAAENADSTGADVFSTSLGYNLFDNTADDYQYANMNGTTSLIARASDIAAAKGIVVVTAAGNEGAVPWKYIATPADAKNVLSVGAVSTTQVIAAFSSYGPTADGRVKPDVCAVGSATVYSDISSKIVAGSGTSYSTPLMAGFAAILWQAYPHLTAQEIVAVIRKAGHLYKTPNDRFGYGIPTFDRAADIIKAEYPITALNLTSEERIFASPNPFFDKITVTIGNKHIGKNLCFELINNLGQSMSQHQQLVTNNTVELAYPPLPVNTYFLKISINGSHISTLKLTKQ